MTDTEFLGAGRGTPPGGEDVAPEDIRERAPLSPEASETALPNAEIAAPDAESASSAFQPSSRRLPFPAGADPLDPTSPAGKGESTPQSTESSSGSKQPSSGRPAESNGPSVADPDAPLDIPWKGVVIFLVVAWAFFRFSWLIFEIAG